MGELVRLKQLSIISMSNIIIQQLNIDKFKDYAIIPI